MTRYSDEIRAEERDGTNEEDSKTTKGRVFRVFLAKELVGSQDKCFGAEEGHNEATVQNVGSLIIRNIFFELVADGDKIE